jgi:predicted RNase H-like nuclease (RuvC/YqgF family)
VGPEYLAIGITALVSAVSGGTWVASKLFSRFHDRIQVLSSMLNAQDTKLEQLEKEINRLPLEYVLKVDFLREIQEMHENFRQINNKLDKLMEKLLTK